MGGNMSGSSSRVAGRVGDESTIVNNDFPCTFNSSETLPDTLLDRSDTVLLFSSRKLGSGSQGGMRSTVDRYGCGSSGRQVLGS